MCFVCWSHDWLLNTPYSTDLSLMDFCYRSRDDKPTNTSSSKCSLLPSHCWQQEVATLRTSFNAEAPLTSQQHTEYQHLFGENKMQSAPKRTLVQRIWAQLNNLLMFVLLAAVVITAILKHRLDTGGIFSVVIRKYDRTSMPRIVQA